MKRRAFLKKAAAGLAVGSVAAPAIAQSSPSVNWRLTCSWPKSLDTLYGGPDHIAKRVAEMAAKGETNRDIAQALYVTPKTVEVHLANCYRKLEIRSRRELPAA